VLRFYVVALCDDKHCSFGVEKNQELFIACIYSIFIYSVYWPALGVRRIPGSSLACLTSEPNYSEFSLGG
jgi:hypothetical protein